MKSFFADIIFFIMGLMSVNAQTFTFGMTGEHNDDYKLSVNITKNIVTLCNGTTQVYESDFFSVATKNVRDRLIFSFYKGQEPVIDDLVLKGNQQYLGIYEGNTIALNTPFNLKEPVTLKPADSVNYQRTFKAMMSFILDDALPQNTYSSYQSASNSGDPYAQYMLAICLLNGSKGAAKNATKAIDLLQQSASHGYVHAMKQLGICYEEGIGTSKNLSEAMKWLKLAAEWGNPEAQYRYGRLLDNKSEAFKWFRKAANQGGHEKAITAVAQAYSFGIGTSTDYAKANQYYKEAVGKGHVSSMYFLALNYYYGKGTQSNYAEARRLLHMAAGKYYIPAYTQLGIFNFEGKCGLQTDYKEAVRWLQKAGDNSSNDQLFIEAIATAQKYLGMCYYKGLGVKKDKKTGRLWMQKALNNGDKEARQLLSKM